MTDIGTVYVQGYGLSYNNKKDASVYADNIKVWKNVDTETETLIYSNDFNTRTRFNVSSRSEGSFSGTKDIVGSGADGWVTRGTSCAAVVPTIAGEANPSVRFGGYQPMWSVLDVGKSYRRGEVKVCVDLRAPAGGRCVGSQKPLAVAAFGNDDFWQGSQVSSASEQFVSAAFGFSAADATEEDTGLVRSFKFCAFDGDGAGGYELMRDTASVTAGNWYRFRATISLETGKYSVQVFDMGSSQPTTATADGSMVAAFADLGFTMSGERVVSSVGFGAVGIDGNAYRWQNANDTWSVRFDNLSFTATGSGLVFLVK